MKYFVTCWIGMIACMMTLFGTTALGAENPSAWPSRPVKIIIPFSPGGGTDNLSRVLGQKLTEIFGQPFIVENRPGAGGTLGSEQVARAAPDGYTL